MANEPEFQLKTIGRKQCLVCSTYGLSNYFEAPTHVAVHLDQPLLDDIEKAVAALAAIETEVQNGVWSICLNAVGTVWGDYDADAGAFTKSEFRMSGSDMIVTLSSVHWADEPQNNEGNDRSVCNDLYFDKLREFAEQTGLQFGLGKQAPVTN